MMVEERCGRPAESGGGILSGAPWWMISAGIHTVALLAATLVYVERLMAVEEDEVIISVARRDGTAIRELERPRDVFERRGLSKDEDGPRTEDPAIFFPEARISDHLESADNEDDHGMKGQSEAFISCMPGEAGGLRGRLPGETKGIYDTMGVGPGGGSGGRFGRPDRGGQENLVPPGRGTRATEGALLEALLWLARHQSPDGSWKSRGFPAQCEGGPCSGPGMAEFDTGVTSLALLAFLGAGYSHLSRDEFPDPVRPNRVHRFGEVVKGAGIWLRNRQDAEGCVGERGPRHMYNHCIAAMALSEAYGMTATEILREPAQRAIDFLVAAQNPGKAWRYSARSGENDTSVTGWAVMALKSAELSGIGFPRHAYEGARSWLDEVTERGGYYLVGYDSSRIARVVNGSNNSFDHHQSMSAVAVMSRIFMLKNRRDPALGAVNVILGDLPEWKENKIDFYYWYYGSLALFQFDGPDGPVWRRWNEPMKNAIVPNQMTLRDGCAAGSWPAEKERWGMEGGRVYAVAINALTLEVYYRYPNVFGGGMRR